MGKVQSRRITTFVLAVIGGSMALVACMVAVAALRSGSNDKPQLPKYGMPVPPSEVCVKSVERKNAPAVHADKAATSAVAVVCGDDPATADRYEARNDVALLMAFMAALAQAVVRGLDVSCGCFGGFAGGTRAELLFALGRDALLLIPSLWLAMRHGKAARPEILSQIPSPQA